MIAYVSTIAYIGQILNDLSTVKAPAASAAVCEIVHSFIHSLFRSFTHRGKALTW